MKYRITIEELYLTSDDNKYNRYDSDKIYEQTVDELNVLAVISAVNEYYQVNSAPPFVALNLRKAYGKSKTDD